MAQPGQPVGVVIGIGGDDPVGQGGGNQTTGSIVVIGRHPFSPIINPDQPIVHVVSVDDDFIIRVSQVSAVAHQIIAVTNRAGERIGDGDGPVEAVITIAGHPNGVGHGRAVAQGVIAVVHRLAIGQVVGGYQPVEAVILVGGNAWLASVRTVRWPRALYWVWV
jgi:hypothetical protein